MKRIKFLILGLSIATTVMAQGVIDVHSHLITPEFLSALESEGRLMDEGFPLPHYDGKAHLKWMDEAGVETTEPDLAPLRELILRQNAGRLFGLSAKDVIFRKKQ